jgi:trehalose-phosphatase
VRFEDKGIGFAVHVRGARTEAKRAARARLAKVIEDYTPELRLVPGSEMWNVLPRQVPGKGPAVRDAMGRRPSSKLVFYLGDDASDEPAFEALGRGITVRVGENGPTKARYRLADPSEVCRFIERLEDELSS